MERTISLSQSLCGLYDQQIQHTLAYLMDQPPQAWDAVPIDSDVMFLGTRVNKITISGLVRHLVEAETHWLRSLPNLDDGQDIGFPVGGTIPQDVNGSALIEAVQAAHQQNTNLLSSLSEADLDKTVLFAGRTYSALRFVVTIIGHHGFHLGQIDLLLRQQGIEPPEYMEWPNDETLIG